MNTLEGSHFYRAYGLTLASAIELPELPRGTAPADVTIRVAPVAKRPATLDERGAGFWIEGEQACHVRQEAGAFLATAGREIVVDPNPEAAPEVVRLSVLGPALGLILMQRGTFALHGSAVMMHGSAVGFLGRNGAGKSTTAALMHARGHTLIADDVMPLLLESDTVRAVPSFPQIKLWPDAADVVGSSAQMPILHPNYTKRALRPTEGFANETVPLRRLYVLNVGDEVGIEPLGGLESVGALLISWYGMRFGPALAKSIDQKAHFVTCTQIAKTVPMRQLRRPGTLREDSTLAAAIESAVLTDLGIERGDVTP